MTRHFPGGFTPYVMTLHGRTDVKRPEKQNYLDLKSETFYECKIVCFFFIFAPVIDLPLNPKHLERDTVSNNCYFSKKGLV